MNPRYTLINLLGLNKAQNHNIDISMNLNKILLNQIRNSDKFNGIGEVGLLLWATALISPEHITKILTKINFDEILSTAKDSKSGYTMELSWFLTGILFASTFNNKFKRILQKFTHKTLYKN